MGYAQPLPEPASLSSAEIQLRERYRERFDAELGFVDLRPETDSTFETLTFCKLLLRSGTLSDMALLGQVLENFFRHQLTDAEDENFGWIPMRIGAMYRDKNAPLFQIPPLVEFAGSEALPPATRAVLREGLKRLFTAAERRWDEEIFDVHRDFKTYTNVYLMQIQALLLGASFLGLPRWERRAHAAWKRWFHHVAYFGIDEFASTTYHEVDHETLTRLLGLFSRSEIQAEVLKVLGHLEAVQEAIEHPLLQLPICGSSRDYRRFLKPASGRFKPFEGRQPEDRRAFPYEAEGRATTVPFRYKSWQDSHSGMGTMTGGHYFWQNLHGLVAVGENENCRELAFLPGTFSTLPGFSVQQGPRALFVFGRVPVSLYRTQIPVPDERIPADPFGIGVTTGWSVRSDTPGRLHLSAFGHELFLDAFAVESGLCVPVHLKRVRRKAGENTLRLACRFGCDIDEYEFPPQATWFGLVAELRRTAPDVPPIPQVEKVAHDRCQTFRANGLEVCVFEIPTGEQVQLHRDDWRTMPLFRSPDHLLWPGQWLHEAANP